MAPGGHWCANNRVSLAGVVRFIPVVLLWVYSMGTAQSVHRRCMSPDLGTLEAFQKTARIGSSLLWLSRPFQPVYPRVPSAKMSGIKSTAQQTNKKSIVLETWSHYRFVSCYGNLHLSMSCFWFAWRAGSSTIFSMSHESNVDKKPN